jgi:hypothetical protein
MPRLLTCPWQNRPTHARNRRLQVDEAVPITYGYCAMDPDCASCAGTGYKPNILLQLGRGTRTLPCPYCEPERYRAEALVLVAEIDRRR